MNPKLLIRNKKAFNVAFATIIVMIIAITVLIWFIFFQSKLAEKGTEGADTLEKVLKGRV